MRTKVLICSLVLAVFAFGAPAWAAKVKICHVPPGNPANFHTITVSENALQSHLGHGDLLGACFEHCDQLCDDGDACTIDACDASEQCLLSHPPVSCDDGSLCTIDSCDSAMGCSSTPKVCQDGGLCTVDSCDPLTGNCVFPPAACPAGQSCNPNNGSCEGAAPACPCVSQIASFVEALHGAFGVTSCTMSYDPGFAQGIWVSTGSSDPALREVLAGWDENGNGRCGFTSGSRLAINQEVVDCIVYIRETVTAAGFTCTGDEVY